jgi:hypothetical protein
MIRPGSVLRAVDGESDMLSLAEGATVIMAVIEDDRISGRLSNFEPSGLKISPTNAHESHGSSPRLLGAGRRPAFQFPGWLETAPITLLPPTKEPTL